MKSALIAIMAGLLLSIAAPGIVAAGCSDGVIENLKTGGACSLDFPEKGKPVVGQERGATIQSAQLKSNSAHAVDQHRKHPN